MGNERNSAHGEQYDYVLMAVGRKNVYGKIVFRHFRRTFRSSASVVAKR